MNQSEKQHPEPKAEEKIRRRTRLGVWLAMGGLFAWRILPSFRHPGKGEKAKSAAQTAEVVAEPRSASPAPPGAATSEGSPELGLLTARAVEQHSDSTKTREEAADEIPARSRDRDLDAEAGVNLPRRQFWGTALAGSGFLLACAAGVAFLAGYWIGASNWFLGVTLAVALAGFGATLVVWAKWLTIQREAVEPRQPLTPPQEVRDAAARSFLEGARDIQRRTLLRWVGYAGIGLAVSTVISLLRSIGFPSTAALNSRVWKRGQRLVTTDGKPVAASDLEPGVTLIVFPEDSIGAERAQTILLRVDQDLLQLPKGRESWAPMGNLAYSRVCTHAGCTVGMYEKTTHLLMCPCHQSTFDVLRAARPDGGPAARALPQLPLYADSDGNLRAGGGFSDPPGPGFWGMA